MKVVDKKLSEIVPYENNPRNNDAAVEKVANSIKEFGFQQPIVVDKDNVIIVGHTRYYAAQELGLDKVPVVVADNLTDEQARAYRLADNKTGEIAGWDYLALADELEAISNIDMSDFGFASLNDDETELDEPPEDFKEFGKEIGTKTKCPKCGYEW